MPNPNQAQTPAAQHRNQAPDRARLLRHMRPPQRPAPDPAMQWREQQARATLTHDLRDAQPLILRAQPLALDTTLPTNLRNDFFGTRKQLDRATRNNRMVEAKARLGDHKRVAQHLVDVAQQRSAQLAQQAALHDEMATVFSRVKKSSFPDGQAEHIGRQDLSAGRHFKDYLLALAELELAKKGVDTSKPVPEQVGKDLARYCVSLIGAADAYLNHHQTDLSASQQADKSSQTKKRYCEAGKLQARQYLLALEFDRVGDPKASPQGWNEVAQMRAATVRAKLNYHQAYQEAVSLKEGGDAAGMSDSLWLQGAEFAHNDAMADNSEAQMAHARRQRVAIFKPFEGEKAAEGSTDKPGAGAAKEALAAGNAKRFAAQTGIDLGVPDTHVVAVNSYAIKGASQTGGALDEVVGSAQFNAGARTDLAKLPGAVRDKVDRRDWQKIAMLDVMQLNCDRHEGNLMVRNADSERPELVPIDHGGSLPSRKDFANIKGRIGGVTNGASGASITNAMLTTPAAYEPFDAELLAKLELLDPAAIEAGMKNQRDAMDEVHPTLGAGAKVGNDSLHLSRRAMMFMKRAARHLSPAEIQIALAQRGEALFDAPDEAAFNALADQVIADFVPLKDAYKEILTGPIDQVTAIADWLKNNGWGTPGGEHFLMQQPVLALKLYRAGKANSNPPAIQQPPAAPKRPVNEGKGEVPEAFKAQYRKEYPGAQEPFSAEGWNDRKYLYDKWAAIPQATKIYEQILERTGAQKDDGLPSKLRALACWAELNKPGNAAMLARLQPNGGTSTASVHLAAALKEEYVRAASDAMVPLAQQQAATIDDDHALKLTVEALLAGVDALAKDPLLAASQKHLAPQAAAVRTEVAQQNWDAAHQLALRLDAQALRAALEALLAIGTAEFEDAMREVPDRSLVHADVRASMTNLRDACLFKRSLGAARFALVQMRTKLPEFRQQHLSLLPAFSWDAKAASAAKKAAIQAKLIADKDTGMSDALKAVSDAQKVFDDALADTSKPEKKRPAGEKCLAAYAKFIQFTNTRLRPLSAEFAWLNYCAGGVKAANTKIAEVRALMGG